MGQRTGSITLGIEVANPGSGTGAAESGVCAVRAESDGVRVLGVEPVRMGGGLAGGRGGHDDDLMPAIDRLFRRLGVSPGSGDLERVAVSAGPGGYTSVRVACAAGKMIAEATGARCVRVESSLVALHSAPERVRRGHVCVLMASKGASAWGRVFASGVAEGPGGVIDARGLELLVDRGVGAVIADEHMPKEMREVADRRGVEMIPAAYRAEACARLGVEGEPIDPMDLLPIYPREPEAVTLWRARGK